MHVKVSANEPALHWAASDRRRPCAGWLDAEWLSMTPTRRLLICYICMVFDRYLNLTGTTTA